MSDPAVANLRERDVERDSRESPSIPDLRKSALTADAAHMRGSERSIDHNFCVGIARLAAVEAHTPHPPGVYGNATVTLYGNAKNACAAETF